MKKLIPFALLIASQGLGWCAAISDQLTVYDPLHAILHQLTVYEDGTFTGGLCAGPCSDESILNTYYIPDTNIANPNLFGLKTYIFDSVDLGAGTGVVSDIVSIGLTDGLVLDFSSAGDGDVLIEPYPPIVDFSYLESQGPYDATMYLNETLQREGYTATFYSAENPSPEPGTLIFVAAGVAAIANRRRFRAARSAQ